MADKPTYKRITVLGKADPATGQFNISDWEKDIRAIVNNAVKSSLTDDTFFQLVNKRGNKYGQMGVDIYVHQDSAPLVERAINQQVASLTHKGSLDPKYSVLPSVEASRRVTRELRREEYESSNTDTESSRSTKYSFLKVIGILTALADITRRILSSVLTFSQKTFQDAITASNLGMSYNAVRSYRHVETAHGLNEGIITGGIADVQNKFGNITSLDEKALEALAVVMGDKVDEMVKVATSEQNPEKAMAMIIDAFNERANSGYNSVGQYVGEANARRELYSYLLKLSPQWADIFATMQEEQHNINSLYRNQADTFENWKNAFPTGRGGDGWGGYGSVELTAQQWNKVKEMFDQMKEHLVVSLAPDVFALLQRIANSRLFMTETEKRKLNEQNRMKNEAEINALDKTISKFSGQYDNMSVGEKAYYDVIVEQREALRRENEKEEIDDVTAPEAILQSRAERRVREAGYQPTSVGEKIKPIEDMTYDELSDVVRTYNLDTPKAREEYAKSRQKDKEDADRKVAVYEANQRGDLYIEYEQKMQASGREFANARKSGVLKKAYKSVGLSAKKALELLYKLGSVYGFAYDLDNEEGRNYEEKIYSALKRAQDEGYGNFDNMGKFLFSREKYVDMHFKPIPKPEEAEIEYGNEYLKWLYEHDPYLMDEINAHVKAYRTDQEIEKMRTENKVQAWEWLYRTEGTKSDWRKTIEGMPNGTYVIHSTNTNPEYGENVYKIVLEARENGRVVSSREVLNTEGGWSFEGDMATIEVVNGKFHYVDGLGTSASEQK